MKQIPYGRHSIEQSDIDSVLEVLNSDFLTQGPQVPAFEKAISEFVSCEYAIAVNSATSALHLACLSLGVGPGDIVWTSPISFVASANCAMYCGADVDFVDIDPLSYNMSVERLSEKLELAKRENKLPKVIIPVHLAGQSCDMKSIFELKKIYGFHIIEDASHAIGGDYLDKKVGSCQYSDITVFSFHPVKIITTGEGGMCVTNNLDIANFIYRLRSHGITRNPKEMTEAPDGSWYYQQIDLGYNYRMNDIQAALGLSQLKRLDQIVQKRHRIKDYYNKILSDLPLVLPQEMDYAKSSLHLYVVQIKPKEMKAGRKEVFERLRQSGILVNVHYIPIYHQPYYQKKYNFKYSDFPEAEKYYNNVISLPIYPELTKEDQDRIKEAIVKPIGHQVLF
ncbi:UDP-4-amino-4,6-dideoxy-N-acetyl-beta-L-altrosamine transaminase [Leptospira levettii]|uniref:UDP-4-amino-4, 6-dideoxy-N-acetyl-beta-L-altrosamine transaminase n=1 Tax=Leptospira levettii TaxID=2023178 RepID=A0AAW5VBR7_9LEPT|nr:UDP-4-amino-4,6-dideoxy-N-acetyl-beta-L-altrosamine transaminase [Leptospira levettii]MCW7466181.1 UDP-4-amino-4,6-dideoxy-N-acetyl-beta-L-altrosamine transaminase [Leptospira levettii]MCW7512294.1 UDP-4-amino-4,6-dideoxy-N-acetyl-beta-L-altrosamine transaminase [Leptospira levettii]MCW7516302.1 UDP-4-amino-4,6-dideoxy-N-acetyl-beta-L-altrosamine transaminase [Leptospira levettii]